jgi:diguanylate cyclase (GGDEF)-like protein
MTDILLANQAAATAPDPSVDPSLPAPQQPMPDIVRDALMESRRRWRGLVTLATDLAFETDAMGRFVFIIPDTALGWPAGSLIGQPSELLIGDDGSGGMFNPFHPIQAVRRRRSWLRCFDGSLVMMTMSITPLYGPAGEVAGARGVGIDMTDTDAHTTQIAGRLRRGEVIDHVLWRVGQETGADNMMDAALWALMHALGAEGAAVIGALTTEAAIEVLHECGPGASAILVAAARLMMDAATAVDHTVNLDGRFILTAGCQTRFGAKAGLAIWRNANARRWDQEDTLLVGSAVRIVRMILEYEAVQREMSLQARTDPLTGLLNRRAFLEEMRRSISRLDRESQAGTLMFIDMDDFKAVNDRLGHAMGDRVLVHLADMLRKLVRPSDLIARLGGDEFAVWLNGADHMTGAERADYLCKHASATIQAMLVNAGPDPSALDPSVDPDRVDADRGDADPGDPDRGKAEPRDTQMPPIRSSVSIGIATRRVGSRETIEDLTRRADMAMYEVKRSGRNHWRVSILDGD